MGALLPGLRAQKMSRSMVADFKGYNHNLYVADNQFYDMGNMTSSDAPVISTRDARKRLRVFTDPNGLMARDHLCWVDGTKFYYNGTERGDVTDSAKQLVGMGAYVLIFPDKKRFNTDTMAFDSLDASWTVLTGTTITYTLCNIEGTAYMPDTVAATAPAEPEDGDLWLDTSGVPHVLKQYSSVNAAWTSIITTYVKIAATDIGALFATGDTITLAGTDSGTFDGSYFLHVADDDYIVITGTLDATVTQTTTAEATVTLARTAPTMDYVVEMNNRLWGCSSTNNEIYASKLGDPTNWNVFQNVSTDSYAVNVGTDGDFTGAITHMGYALFFKDGYIHRVYGSAPSNFQVSTVQAQGVQAGCSLSLVAIDGVLYYKSRDGICAYNGGFPALISQDLGAVVYSSAVAGSVDSKYYISMKDAANAWHLFVYDTLRGMWHREDATQVMWFAREAGELYFIKASDKALWTVHGTSASYTTVGEVQAEGDPAWYLETGDIGAYTPDRKYIGKLQLRVEADTGATLAVSVKYDGASTWTSIYTATSPTRRTYLIPILPRRCDHMRFKISGTGKVRLFSITRMMAVGSEV